MSRTAIFFDGGHFTDGVRGLGMSIDMDFNRFVKHLVPEDEIVAIHFVVPEYPAFPYPAKHRNEKRRLEVLAGLGWTIHVTKPQIIGSVFVDRGVDATLTARLLIDAYENVFDKAVVIAQRPELSQAIEAAVKIGKIVETAFFSYSTNAGTSLADVATSHRTLSEDDILPFRRSGAKPPKF